VPGEFEVLGQLRRALELATEEQTAGPEITELFQRAIASGRRVRIGNADRARQHELRAGVGHDGDRRPRRFISTAPKVVIIGAGQLASGICAGRLLVRPRAPSSTDDLLSERPRTVSDWRRIE